MSQNLIAALNTFYAPTADAKSREQADKYLREFQKEDEAWQVCLEILRPNEQSTEAKLFCAQTLRSKIVFDLHQVPHDQLLSLKENLVGLFEQYKDGPKLIRTQLAIALANFSLQVLQWQGVLPEMVQRFNGAPAALLQFLKVLPEELSDMKRTFLSDEEYQKRTDELLQENAKSVLELLLQYSSSQDPTVRELVFYCINSWLGELDVVEIINSPLLDIIFNATGDDATFEPAVDCICSLVRETRDVHEFEDSIAKLHERVLKLRPKIHAEHDDPEVLRGLTRLFSEAAESWHVTIARNPDTFRSLVETVCECAAFDDDLDVVQYTFYFWYNLKQLLVLEAYQHAREVFRDIYAKLIDIMIAHLHYPMDGFSDKNEEDKFRTFRHDMGDVLKDCCVVIGASEALAKPFNEIVSLVEAGRNGQNVPWQKIEAPLFSMRSMGKEVSPDESVILPRLMQLLVSLPEHEKIRYAATLVLGRYTAWTANNPQFLQDELNYITAGFSYSVTVQTAAAQALMHFCHDCGPLLADYTEQLHTFYTSVGPQLDLDSLYEITDGLAHVVDTLPQDRLYSALESFCDPTFASLALLAKQESSEATCTAVADQIEVVKIFLELIRADYNDPQNPLARYVLKTWPVVTELLSKHGKSSIVAERITKYIKFVCLRACGPSLKPILGEIANLLVVAFENTQYGCFLWTSGEVLRVFGPEECDAETREASWEFAQRQISTAFAYISQREQQGLEFSDISDLIEDLFRLLQDTLLYFPYRLITSSYLEPIVQVILMTLQRLEHLEPLIACLHFSRDLLSFGFESPSSSAQSGPIPPDVRATIVNTVATQGQQLTTAIIIGLIHSFPGDCATDASGMLLAVFQLANKEAAVTWIAQTLDQLPAGSVADKEREKLLQNATTAFGSGDYKRVRVLVRDFAAWYSRRNVTRRTRLKLSGPNFVFRQ